MEALHDFADLTDDDDLAVAIVKRLDAIAVEYGQDSALASTGEAVERLELENLSGCKHGLDMLLRIGYVEDSGVLRGEGLETAGFRRQGG
jgi:hypothetical protein